MSISLTEYLNTVDDELGYTIQGETGYTGSIGYTGSRGFDITDDSISGSGIEGDPFSVAKLATPVNISLTGDISGTASFDGSQNVNIVTTLEPTYTFTKTLILTDAWQDVGINNTNLATGSYIMQVYLNDVSVGGKNTEEYITGIVSWYAGATNPFLNYAADEIVLHRAGKQSEANVFLRTFRSELNNDDLKLQILSTTTNTNSSDYVFKFKKII